MSPFGAGSTEITPPQATPAGSFAHWDTSWYGLGGLPFCPKAVEKHRQTAVTTSVAAPGGGTSGGIR
jgi:hypothetical protein